MQSKATNIFDRLFFVVAAGALLVTVGSWTLGFLAKDFVPRLPFPGWIAAVLVVLIPEGVAAWSILRRLRATRPTVEARRITIAFAVSTPALLLVSYVVGDVVSYFTGYVFGRQFVLPAMLVFVLLVMAIVPASFVTWDLRSSQNLDVWENNRLK